MGLVLAVYQISLLPERILKKICISKDGCWNWMGGDTGKGHGKVKWEGHYVVIHRIVYKLLVSEELPDELPLDHLCRNRRCCNPHHLEPVTHKVNTHRGLACLFKPLPQPKGKSAKEIADES